MKSGFFFSLSWAFKYQKGFFVFVILCTDPLWDYISNFKFMIIKPGSCDNLPSGTESSQHLTGGVQHLVGFTSHYTESWSTPLGGSKGTVSWIEISLTPPSPQACSNLHHRLSTFANSCINTPKSASNHSGKEHGVFLLNLVCVWVNEGSKMRDVKALMWRDEEILVSWQFAAAIILLMSLRGHALKQASQVFISPQLSFQLWPDLKLCHSSTEMKCSLRKRSCWENTGSQAYQTAGGEGLSPAEHCSSAQFLQDSSS